MGPKERALQNLAPSLIMAPMKAMNAKPLTKGAIAESLAAETELKKSMCSKILNSLSDIAAKEVKSTGVFTIPGLCKIKTRTKPATKAGQREVFGKIMVVKAKPARKVVKAFPVSALKKSFEDDRVMYEVQYVWGLP